jgi:hypothetical protein
MRAALVSASGASETLPPSADRSEHWPAADLRRRQPRLHGLDRTEPVAAGYGDLLAPPFLVALAAPDQDPRPVRNLGQVRDFERAQL